MKVKSIWIEHLENEGCNNGNYPWCEIHLDNGIVFHGRTCRCGGGCNNTDRLPNIGQEFESINELRNFMDGYGEEV